MNKERLPLLIFAVFVFSLAYWIYLGLNTRMDISWDARDYQQLGQLIDHRGFVPAYFQKVNREPVYPLLVAAAMRLDHWTSLPYTKIMAFFGVGLLLMTQILLYNVLRLLYIRPLICAAGLAYFAVSPALTNGAFSLYSEIAVYPFALAIILASHWLWQNLEEENHFALILFNGVLLGILFTAATLVKAVYEGIFPIFLGVWLAAAFLSLKKNRLACLWAGVSVLVFYYAPIISYKNLNRHYNGNYAVTNRGAWALYGNTARRMEPLTTRKVLTALAYVPGEGVCTGIFGSQDCEFWSFRVSDALSASKETELTRQYGQSPEVGSQLLQLSIQQAKSNPAQYALLSLIEGAKMFFWESTRIGFVFYPAWLDKIYKVKLFNNALRLALSLLSLAGAFYVWQECLRRRAPPLIALTGFLLLLFIGVYSPFFILSRYALPIAPLYLICIAYAANSVYTNRHDNKAVNGNI